MKPKFQKGPAIRDPMVAVYLIATGQNVFWNHKCQNPVWMQNQQLRTLIASARRGSLFQAIPIEKEPA